MQKIGIFFSTFLLIMANFAFAEDVELLDTYLEELPGSDAPLNQDAHNQSQLVQPTKKIEYRRAITADGSEIYEAVPIQSDASTLNPNEKPESSELILSEPVILNNATTEMTSTAGPNMNQANLDQRELEVIELEPDDGEFVVIEAPEGQATQAVSGSADNAVTGAAFCQKNPYARECLLSNYLSLCEKDPQSIDCKSQLEKFDRFCEAFPRAYKCKKAEIAASCKQNPNTKACLSFTQRYCQKYPKAVFCNYN